LGGFQATAPVLRVSCSSTTLTSSLTAFYNGFERFACDVMKPQVNNWRGFFFVTGRPTSAIEAVLTGPSTFDAQRSAALAHSLPGFADFSFIVELI
jgi:hypothetical protein